MTGPRGALERGLAAIDGISGLSGRLAAWLVVPLVLGTCYEVFARYLFNAPTQWAFHLAYMLYAALALLGGAYTLRQGGHIRTDFLYDRLSPRRRAVVDLVGYVLLLPALGLYLAALADVAAHASSIREPLARLKWTIVVGCGLLALQAVAELVRAARAVRRPPAP
jgi:TRAP-type mannitol/chloroaromatic compound transport system permease small subunit